MKLHTGTLAGAVIALAMIILLAVNAAAPDLGCITDTECEEMTND